MKECSIVCDELKASAMRTLNFRNLSFIILLLISTRVSAQFFVDPCLNSVTPVNSSEFTSTASIASVFSADVLEWTGSSWNGGFPAAGLSIPPPTGEVGCRAFFLGSSSSWTTGGETAGLLMTSPLVAGQTYSIDITYVSHGLGSNGAYQPWVNTNNSPSLAGANLVEQLPPVGNNWTTYTLTFTASAAQDGDTWMMIGTSPSGSSGLVSSFCENCVEEPEVTCDVNLGPDTVICDGESVVFDASTADATYEWQDGSTNATFEATTSGSYTVTIQTGECTASDTVELLVNPVPSVDLGDNVSFCEGGSVLLDAFIPGASYEWQDGSQNSSFEANATGSYSVTVTLNNCSASDVIEVTAEAPPQVNLGQNTSFCEGASLLLDATWPNATYAWQDGANGPTYEVTESGIYEVTITTSECEVTESVEVTVDIPPVVDLGDDLQLCQGESAQLDAFVAGANYEWQDGSNSSTIQVTQSGIYTVEVTLGACVVTAEAEAIVDQLPLVAFDSEEIICEGETILLDATWPDAMYAWQDGSSDATLEAATSGTYQVTVTSGSCTVTASTDVVVTPLPLIDLGEAPVLCEGESYVIDAGNAGADYLWSNDVTSQTITVTASDNYSVTVTDANGCSNSAQIEVTFETNPVVNLPLELSICEDESVILDAGITDAMYEWSTGEDSQSIEVSESGTYTVVVTTNSGCSAQASSNLSIATYPSVDLGDDQSLCIGEVTTLDAGNQLLNISWSTGESTSQITVAQSGIYSVTVDNDYCFTSATVSVTFNPLPVDPQLSDTTFCFFDPPYGIELDAGNPGSTYAWSNGSNEQMIDALTPGAYTVTITTELDCSLSFSSYIGEFCEGGELFVPNAFTPDGDGVNEFFKAYGQQVVDFEIEVWNRWGDLVWSADNIDAYWIGNYQGGDYFVPNDVYVYVIKYKYITSDEGDVSEWIVKKGHVTLLR